MPKSKAEVRKWNISIPIELAVRLDRIMNDPLYQKPKYGARSFLVTYLLKEFADRLEREREDAKKENANA